RLGAGSLMSMLLNESDTQKTGAGVKAARSLSVHGTSCFLVLTFDSRASRFVVNVITRTSSAMVKATVDFSRFIGISSLGVEFWWTSPSRDWNATARRHAGQLWLRI